MHPRDRYVTLRWGLCEMTQPETQTRLQSRVVALLLEMTKLVQHICENYTSNDHHGGRSARQKRRSLPSVAYIPM